MSDLYIFKSERLGFRNWLAQDLSEFIKLNADNRVMEHFPRTLSEKESQDLLDRLQQHFFDKGHTYFVTEILETGEFIGFIGLAYQEYETIFTPAVDIGWRLKKSAWGNGYATEGAKRCIDYGFERLNLNKIIATCTQNNSKSENVMRKISMKKKGEFIHPELKKYPEYKKCIWYEINKIE